RASACAISGRVLWWHETHLAFSFHTPCDFWMSASGLATACGGTGWAVAWHASARTARQAATGFMGALRRRGTDGDRHRIPYAGERQADSARRERERPEESRINHRDTENTEERK